MATVKIWDVKSRLDRVIDYAANTEKTCNKGYSEVDTESLNDVIEYAADEFKTEQSFYVTGINCQPEFAVSQMSETKKRWNKTEGILAFHAYQSFAPGEVSPNTAHEIGVSFAKHMWGERFEVVVATHVTSHCIHNHYVLNSVSFVDGKKYYDNRDNYAKMRLLSDDLCREHSLSVIDNPKEKSTENYAHYQAEQQGGWTKDAIIRRDIDESVLETTSPKAFYLEMKKKGYSFNFNRKYPTISHPNFERSRRLKTLGEDYRPERIEERIMSKWQRYEVPIPEQDNPVEEYFVPLNNPGYKEIYVAFVTVVELVKRSPKNNRGLDKYIIEEMHTLDKLIEQQNLLCDNDIETDEQLAAYKKESLSELQQVAEARDRLRFMLSQAKKDGDEREASELKDTISTLTKRMRILRRNIKICERIEKTKPVIESKIQSITAEKQREEVMRNEHSRRFGRTNGTNEPSRG